MSHSNEEFNLKTHLRDMRWIFAIGAFLISGMIASMMLLVIAGLEASISETPTAYTFTDIMPIYGPLMLVVMLIVIGFFVRWYFRYARVVRKDPSKRFEL